MVTSNGLVRTSIGEKLTSEQRFEGGEGVKLVGCWALFIHSSKAWMDMSMWPLDSQTTCPRAPEVSSVELSLLIATSH